MRCRHGSRPRRQHPETKHAAGQCDNIEERLHLAIDRPFDRDEPQGHRIEDQGAGADIEILQADQAQPEASGHLKETHRDKPALPFTTAPVRVSEAQAESTDRDGPAEQTDAGEKQRRRRLQDILDRKPVCASNNDDECEAAEAGQRIDRLMFHRATPAGATCRWIAGGWLSAIWNARLFSSGV
jgi:hypothetical protein